MNGVGRLKWFILLYIIWIILFARIDVFVLVSGVLFSVFAIYYTEHFLLEKQLSRAYPLNIRLLFTYYIKLIYEIYASGFQTIGLIVNGDIKPAMITIKTDLHNDFYRTILANSITLTPGTVTVDKQGDQLTVLWLDATTNDPTAAGEMIKGRLERHLQRGDRQCNS